MRVWLDDFVVSNDRQKRSFFFLFLLFLRLTLGQVRSSLVNLMLAILCDIAQSSWALYSFETRRTQLPKQLYSCVENSDLQFSKFDSGCRIDIELSIDLSKIYESLQERNKICDIKTRKKKENNVREKYQYRINCEKFVSFFFSFFSLSKEIPKNARY